MKILKLKLSLYIKLIALSLLLSACTPDGQQEFDVAIKQSEQKQYYIALSFFERVLLRAPESPLAIRAAQEASKLAFYEVKDYRRSIKFYRHLVLYSKDPRERLKSQKQIVDIVFENLAEYDQAVVETNRLLGMLNDEVEKAHYKAILARAYYFQNNFVQAANEIDEQLKVGLGDEQKFELLLLRANIDIAQKNLAKAVVQFKQLLEKYPEKSRKENIPLILSVVYEENKDFKNAIAVLEDLKPHHPIPEYIDLRIKRIREHQRNQPGAKGARK